MALATNLQVLGLQERDEAARLFGAAAAAAAEANGEKTFEPGEGMAEVEAPSADTAKPAAEAMEEPSVQKGPTQEQLTAIKARARGLAGRSAVQCVAGCRIRHGALAATGARLSSGHAHKCLWQLLLL